MDLGRLPFVPFAALAQRTPLRELFEVSLASDRARQWIHMSGTEAHSFVIFATNNTSAFFIQKTMRTGCLWFTLDAAQVAPARRVIDLNGHLLNIISTDMAEDKFFCRTRDPARDVLHLLNYFVHLLVIHNSNVHLDIARLAEFRMVFAQPMFRRRCECLNLTGALATNEDVNEVIRYFPNVSWLIMRGRYLPSLRCPQIYAADNIDIERGVFVSVEDVMGLNCRTAKIRGTTFSKEDLNDILLNWMNSNNKTLEKLIIGIPERLTDLDVVTQDTMYTWFDDTKRSRYHRTPYLLGEQLMVDAGSGRDIVNGDGVIGSVNIVDGAFVFVVFLTPFHELE